MLAAIIFVAVIFMMAGCMVRVKKVLGTEAEHLSSIPNYTTYSAYDLGQGTIRKGIN